MIIKTTKSGPLTDINYQQARIIIEAAQEKKVTKIINIGVDYEKSLQSIQLAQNIPGVFAVVGIHPCDAQADWKLNFEKIKKLVAQKKEHKIVGIGETGLDFYHPGFVVERQEAVFRAHIELALEYNLALVVHTRNAIDETLKILQEYTNSSLTGVIHCFSENWSTAQQIIDMNFMLGIGGIITYPKNEYLRDVVRNDFLQNIVLETDAPFLPPQEIRGKQNSPAQVRTIADYIAELLEISWQEVATKTTTNAEKLFF
jgi:TatD DNase family protein